MVRHDGGVVRDHALGVRRESTMFPKGTYVFDGRFAPHCDVVETLFVHVHSLDFRLFPAMQTVVGSAGIYEKLYVQLGNIVEHTVLRTLAVPARLGKHEYDDVAACANIVERSWHVQDGPRQS